MGASRRRLPFHTVPSAIDGVHSAALAQVAGKLAEVRLWRTREKLAEAAGERIQFWANRLYALYGRDDIEVDPALNSADAGFICLHPDGTWHKGRPHAIPSKAVLVDKGWLQIMLTPMAADAVIERDGGDTPKDGDNGVLSEDD